jgi:transcriptional regulator with GAF, ATPase, and Fis domain
MSHRFSDDSEQQTAALTRDVDALTYQRFAVHVVEGAEQGARVESEGEELSIGSAEGSGMLLSDRAASRHHCVITATPAGFLLRDLDSTNGTKLGGYKIGSAYLKSGATFVVGRTTLRFDSLDELVSTPVSREQQFGSVLGRSASMRKIFALLPRVAASDSTILIEGETGTGKTLVASAIHDASPRADGPFVVVDCAAMTPTLIESQLFGHVRGAYTGASDTREGAFVAAAGGTVFLDEVGELPLEMQPKLLRVLEERVVTPLGQTGSVPIDVRVVAATNRDLREQVNRGGFRADLFYRLHVVRLRVPPLRERPEDVEQLALHFWEQCGPANASLGTDVIEHWKCQRWSGNVRELRSAVERVALLGQDALHVGDGSTAQAVVEPVDVAQPFRAAKEQIVTRFERQYLSTLYSNHNGNISAAARAARMDRNYLRELLRKHGLVSKS